MKRLLLVLTIILSLFLMISCSKDDENTTAPTKVEAWVGTWLSAGTNVSPLLGGATFNIDSIRVEMKENKTITTASHVKSGAWTTLNGTYTVTKAASGDIHSIEIVYTAYSQGGIIQVIKGSPDTMKLEVIQTVPAIPFTPRTPETGFGSDAALGVLNIQKYVRLK
ncbi:MAG TPA: hypothetical protein PKI62_10150 [bacterium]|nr:hypothetical protein [bacterium]HPR89172.1 hypothetical protein [bacterium]